ncbi:hypothetical protein V2G26_008799 [Clonostachys chloroleuca]
MNTLQESFRVATSKPVRRALVNTAILISGATTLLGLAAIATALFFQNYVPHRFLTTPVHLQYGSGLNPYGLVSLTSPVLKSAQDYDVSVTLTLPRSPPNLERGNFMVSLHLLRSDISSNLNDPTRLLEDSRNNVQGQKIVFSTRRTALIPYVDPFVSLTSRALFVLYHMFVPSSLFCTMDIPLAEHVSFPSDGDLPASAYIEIEAGQSLQTYTAALNFTAQLRGLRGLMYNYRIPMYIIFTSLFWLCEILFMAGTWGLWGLVTSSSPEPSGLYLEGENFHGTVKKEEEQESEFERKWSSAKPPRASIAVKTEPVVKDEDDDGSSKLLSEIPVEGAEADDEDEDGTEKGSPIDSGIGTGSYSGEGSSVRRRASRNMEPEPRQ